MTISSQKFMTFFPNYLNYPIPKLLKTQKNLLWYMGQSKAGRRLCDVKKYTKVQRFGIAKLKTYQN